MSWDHYDNKHKRHKDANFVSCEERYELAYVRAKVKEAFPEMSREQIYGAIDRCCRLVETPKPREAFVECLLDHLRLD